MVIGYSDFCLTAIFPTKNDPPLLVDSDAPESVQITSERFQAISRWNGEVLQRPSLIEHAQLPPRPVLNLARKLARTPAPVYPLSLGVTEALDHR